MSKVVGSVTNDTLAALRLIVPDQDEPLKPWGSIVHWTELYLVREPGKNRGYTKWVVPVTCGHRVSPDCRGKRDVIVLRGMSGTEILTPDSLTGRGNIYSGVCMPCLKVKEYPELSPGSYVCLGDDNEKGTLYKCGGCRKIRRRRIKEPKEFTGLCISCGQREAKGSQTIREGANKGKIPFNCANCGREAFAWPHQHKSSKWKRLCPDCQKPNGGPPPWGWNAVNKDDELPLTGAPAYLSQRKFPVPQNRGTVNVQCVFPVPGNTGGICGELTEFNFKVLRREWNNATGYCPSHEISGRVSRREAYAIIEGLKAQAQNGKGQKNGGGEKNETTINPGSSKKAGRPRKFTDEQAFNAIDELGQRVSVSALARTLECTRPTVNDWVHDKGFSNLLELVQNRQPRV